ncbi:MAG: aminodeoxychorismate/anthranilate synthase component II [Deltaproteobacteria bacterium]|nr:aminodeoxychorismate/anthranilate synthase component II [Deltaproteobacteria bacterium]
MAKLLVIDNYDSFTYNLVQMFMDYGLDIRVYRADRISLQEAISLKPDYILISPGPKDPAHSGISIPLIGHFYRELPVMGVCLGMQCINEFFGGKTVRAPRPVHGKTSRINHKGEGLFCHIPLTFTAARYHSLMIKPVNSPMIITAMSDDNVIMGISHPEYPLHGVQFHPESFLTQHGITIIRNFLESGPLNTHN